MWQKMRKKEGVDGLVRRSYQDIFRLALSITGSPDLAEDVTQEVCIRLSKTFLDVTELKNPKAWIRKATVRCSIDAINRRVESSLIEEVPFKTSDPDESIAVMQTLGLLSPEHRVILALALGEGLSYEEIAEELQIPIGSVGSRLHHARARFRDLWEKTL
jgi:RNA polymerase sigma-70 factor (ECF subfamily)